MAVTPGVSPSLVQVAVLALAVLGASAAARLQPVLEAERPADGPQARLRQRRAAAVRRLAAADRRRCWRCRSARRRVLNGSARSTSSSARSSTAWSVPWAEAAQLDQHRDRRPVGQLRGAGRRGGGEPGARRATAAARAGAVPLDAAALLEPGDRRPADYAAAGVPMLPVVVGPQRAARVVFASTPRTGGGFAAAGRLRRRVAGHGQARPSAAVRLVVAPGARAQRARRRWLLLRLLAATEPIAGRGQPVARARLFTIWLASRRRRPAGLRAHRQPGQACNDTPVHVRAGDPRSWAALRRGHRRPATATAQCCGPLPGMIRAPMAGELLIAARAAPARRCGGGADRRAGSTAAADGRRPCAQNEAALRASQAAIGRSAQPACSTAKAARCRSRATAAEAAG